MTRQAIFPYTVGEANKAGISNRTEVNRDSLFATRMREARANSGVTQQAAGKISGVTRSTIGLYETGDNVPDVKTLTRLADLYGVTVNYLLCQDERPTFDEEFVFKKTGLHNKSIEKLRSIADTSTLPNDPLNTAMNALICNERFVSFVLTLFEYTKAAELESEYERKFIAAASEAGEVWRDEDALQHATKAALSAGSCLFREACDLVDQHEKCEYLLFTIHKRAVDIAESIAKGARDSGEH